MPCQYHIDIFWHLINNIVLRQSPWLLACTAAVLRCESCLASVRKKNVLIQFRTFTGLRKCLLNFSFCCLNRGMTWNSVWSVHNLAWSSSWRVTHYRKSDVRQVYVFLCLSLPYLLLLLIQDNARLFKVCTSHTSFPGPLQNRFSTSLDSLAFSWPLVWSADLCTLMEVITTGRCALCEQMMEAIEFLNVSGHVVLALKMTLHDHLSIFSLDCDQC